MIYIEICLEKVQKYQAACGATNITFRNNIQRKTIGFSNNKSSSNSRFNRVSLIT